jgi:tRNA A37 methylthiotransferase MiaB
METYRKELNWRAICSGRDLLKEIQDLEQDARIKFETSLRHEITNQILTYCEYPTIKTGCAGDSLD